MKFTSDMDFPYEIVVDPTAVITNTTSADIINGENKEPGTRRFL